MKMKILKINLFFLVFLAVAIPMCWNGLVSWWVLLLIVLSHIELTTKLRF